VLDQEMADERARDVMSWVENAMMDLGDELEADMMYEDVNVMCDLTWDRIHDSSRTEEERMQVAETVIELTHHDPLKQACQKYAERLKEKLC